MIQLYAIIIGASAVFGAMGGFYTCHTYFSHAYLKDRVEYLEKNIRRYEAMIGVNQKLDADASETELSNKEIEDAILRKAAELEGPDDPVCLTADFMRELKKLR